MANVAVITNCWNERVNLPRWIRYYAGQFGERNLFVLDDGSDDGSTDQIGSAVSVLRLPKAEFDDRRRMRLVQRAAHMLLDRFDAFIYTDCDEFLVPDPNVAASLAEYADAFVTAGDREFVTAIGLNVLHDIDQEAALDPSRPILAQRRYAEFAGAFCKPLLSRIPLSWAAGFHFCNRAPAFDDLYLFHMKYADFDGSLARQRLNRGVYPEDAEKGVWRLSDRQFEAQFHRRVNRPVAQDFDLEPHKAAFLADIVELESGLYVRSRPMDRIPTIYRIPERFAGMV